MPFGRAIDELIHRQQKKIQSLMSHYRFDAIQGSANRNSCHGIFGGGHIKHTITAEAFLQAGCGIEDCFWISDAQSIANHRWVNSHRRMQGIIDCRSKVLLGHC